MPAEQGGRDRDGRMDDRSREHGHDEDVRGIGESNDFEETEDVEDMEEDEEDEGSF